MKKININIPLRRGFTILEVLMALGLVVMVASMVLSIQMRIFERMKNNKEEVDRIFLLKQTLTQTLLQTPLTEKKIKLDIEEPSTIITIEPAAIEKKSSLAPWADRLVMLHAQAAWKSENIGMDMRVVAVALKLPKEKEKKP